MNKYFTALRTNENGVRTRTLIVAGISAATIGLGIYLTNKNSATPVVLLVEEAVETVTDATQS